MSSKNILASAGGPIADRICRALFALEESKGTPFNETSDTQKNSRRKAVSLDRERHALNELHLLLNNWEAIGRMPRHLLANAVSALFQCLDHCEQSLRFIADQTLDAVFRKFLLKFQAEKVVVFLLNELSKKANSARTICAAMQKLSWTIGKAKAQRTNAFLTHLLNAIGICLQRPEESVHIAVEQHFPAIFAQIGPLFVAINHAEKADELFAIALENIELKGAKNRAAAVAIVQLAKFVPSIFHKCFCALSKIVFEADQNEHKMRLVGSLNVFRMLWAHLVENSTENSQPILRKLLSKVLCFLCCEANELLVSALEFLRECAQSAAVQSNSAALFNFNPFTVLSDHKNTSDFVHHFPFDLPNTERNEQGESAAESIRKRQTIGDDAESVFSVGTSKMSAWSSLADLAAVGEADTSPQMEFGIEDLNMALSRMGINIEGGDEIVQKEGEKAEKESAKESDSGDEEEEKSTERESADGEEDKFSVISAELFVDPLMNCFHQQKMKPSEEDKQQNNGEKMTIDQIEKRKASSAEVGAQCAKEGTFGRQSEATNGAAAAAQKWDGLLCELSQNVPFDSEVLSFWLHSSLSVARRFLLSGHGQLYDDSEVRISHKILAMEFLANAAMVEPHLESAKCLVMHADGHRQPITDLFSLISHEDDNLAIAALKFAFNIGKWKLWKLVGEQKMDGQQRHGTEERGRLAWHLKKTLHANRGPNRVKNVLRLCSQSPALFSCPFDDGQLLGAACECAISSADCDYFLVKNCRVEFLASIRWSRTLPKCRLRLQNVCLRLFLRHLFDTDPRVQNAARNAMPKLILNLHFSDSSMRLPFAFPQCFEQEANRQLPILLGICPQQFPFKAQNSSVEHILLAQNLAHFLHDLRSVAFANFSECQFGFVSALATLVDHFPPTASGFSSVWLTSFCGIDCPPPFSRGQSLPNGHKLLFLLLECAESSCTSLSELNSLLKLIASFFAGISEGHLLADFEFDGHGTNFRTQFLGIGQNKSDEAHSKHQHPLSPGAALLERLVLLLLRVLNLFYAVVAEERTLRMEKNASAGASSAESAFATLLSRSMFLGPSHEKQSQGNANEEIGIGTAAAQSPKVVNFSFLIGSGIKPSRPSSFTHSDTLNSLEPSLKGAYKTFIEHLNPNSFVRFLEPLESAICAFCALLEVANLALVRTFLDELLLYQRMLIDLSPANSARLIHQLLKCVFNTNAQNLNGKAIRQNEIWEQHIIQSNDPLERHLSGPLNNFTVFTAFVLRTEFADAFVARLCGWLLPNRLRPFPSENSQVLGELLHQFEPFISHLLKLYPLTNSTDTKRAILDCVCSLCLCNVSYEQLDRNGKFHGRILAQLRQLSPVDDVPLLPNILAFLCVLERINFIRFSEMESVMTDLFNRMDDANCAFILEAMQIVLLSICLNLERKGKRPEEHLRCLTRLKTLLVGEFTRTFCTFPVLSAQCWIILVNELRQHNQPEECWTDASLELFSLLTDFCSRDCSIPSASLWHSFANALSPNASDSADWIRRMFLFSFLLSVCSPIVFRPVDEFFHSIQNLFDKFAAPPSPFPKNCQIRLQILHTLGPLLFVLLNNLNEDIFLLRMGTIFEAQNFETDEEKRTEMAINYFGRNIALLLTESLRSLYSDSACLFPKLEGLNALSESEEATALFLLFTLHQCIRAGRAPRLVGAVREQLRPGVGLVDLCRLASVSPPLFLFWLSLLLLLRLDLPFSPGVLLSIPAHCQNFVIHLAVHALCGEEMPKNAENFGHSQAILSHFPPEFCVRLLLLVEEEKTFKKLLNRLNPNSIRHLVGQVESALASADDRQTASVLPRLCSVMAKSEDPVHLERVSRMMELGQSHWKTLLKDEEEFSIPKSSNKPTNVSAKNLSQLFSNSLDTSQFYRLIAKHFRDELSLQICLGLFILDKNAILDILALIGTEWQIRRRFFRNLFFVLFDLQNEGNRQAIVDALVEFEFFSFPCGGHSPSADERVFILSHFAELFQQFTTLKPIIFPRESVEKVFNCVFLRMLVQMISTQKKIPSDYFKAIAFFFSFQSVRNFFSENDIYTVRSLQQFLTTIWEHLEKGIPRWHRLHIDRQHWAVKVLNSKDIGDEFEEQLLKLFNTVQRIVFSTKNGRLAGEATGEAFRALLGVSLFQRMALVPESALRLGWSLLLDAHRSDASGRILVPLVQIHMLNDPEVLSDFSWRALWLGWSSRAQFEDLWMSLFGVLSSTPTTALEIQQRVAAESFAAAQRQMVAANLAIEALTNILLQTLLFPNPGSPIDSEFVVKHRRTNQKHPFFESEFGRMAICAKNLTDQMLGKNKRGTDEHFTQNLENPSTKVYSMGQTSLFHLRSFCGLIEQNAEEKWALSSEIRMSSSAHLIAQSAELDISSSLRALFDTFVHWLNSSELAQFPMAILCSALRSLTFLSDLFNDPAFYRQTFVTLGPLVGHQKILLDGHPTRGNVILLLLKCVSVLEWSELADVAVESCLSKLVDSLFEFGVRSTQCQSVRGCFLVGLLYLFQSDNLRHLQPSTITNISDFLINELQRMQRRTDILTDFQADFLEYNQLAWAMMFFIVEQCQFLPLTEATIDHFLHIVSDSFVDPRIPSWQKEGLTRGIESLVLTNCSYAPFFRKMALECFATYQLQPSHLPFSLSVYLTCIYRELHEGGEFAYGVNKAFPIEDFHKFLNVFSFYASGPPGGPFSHCVVKIASDLICSVWCKEFVLDCVWGLLVPPTISSPKSPKTVLIAFEKERNENESKAAQKTRAEGTAHPLQQGTDEDEKCRNIRSSVSDLAADSAPLRLTPLDRSLLRLLHTLFKTLFMDQRRVCLELVANFLLPKMNLLENRAMAKCVSLMLLCSANGNGQVQQRIHFLLHSDDPFTASFFGFVFPPSFIEMMVHSFIGEMESLQFDGVNVDQIGQNLKQMFDLA